ncbi:hypothetical protein BCR33DRAFT_246107 [Rhizoclosmatium globosum]|uniref:Uncharacterized protein n=1 Tax=Rhizoclosmatium globosum TaxID=329046 RepID=A0A1Y2CA01_9FUNG|nr:hypothetical protein BCR33DRAFT_246107 [Rhizoclosmatium globosum]|eukprot:ORY43684.1 hypothetical protein BCR33DRAFT_246107 [Rhizoclosmatium globosum]
MSCDVVICPLLPSHRQQVQQRLDANPRFLLDIYLKHKDFSYPLGNILKVVAAASDPLYKAGTYASKTFSAVGGVVGIQIAESKSIFCSELVSTVYRGAELPTFVKFNPDQVTPLELEVAEEFGGLVYYVKEAGVVLLHEGKMIPATTRLTRAHLLLASKLHNQTNGSKSTLEKVFLPFNPMENVQNSQESISGERKCS